MGASSQAAKTNLEQEFESFGMASLDCIIIHGLKALTASISDEGMYKNMCSVAIVGKNVPFTTLEEKTLEPYLLHVRKGEGLGSAGKLIAQSISREEIDETTD